ncbi:protein kinase [Theileria orientalis strain Shintoku]|uniref:Protein kinase n=1 Tax=Theileria orientalis strain Shintoku TaxID=869250 RepID=J4DQ36_THEOR|nr:protein kinase [Theileria orientalis strain Shintoku]BAM41769.1 protein kinase [Theileria orientalis strain Shintoku]|eukprot:XP_009692070.1 protein kinase [Theileria orientalis strain Shintoku]
MEERAINLEFVDSNIPLVFVNSNDKEEVFVVPSDYPYKLNRVNLPENNSSHNSGSNAEYPVLPKLVKTPRRTLIAYSPSLTDQIENMYKVPFDELFGDDVAKFLDNKEAENGLDISSERAYSVSNKFIQEIKKHRRHYVFCKQWKRNLIQNYLVNYYMEKYSENLNGFKNEFKSKVLNNKEFSRLFEENKQINDLESNYKSNDNIRDWRKFNPSYFKSINDMLNKYHDYLYKEQEKNKKLKHKASSVSRYFFEILAEAKECERKMYECELIAEENTYGRRDFISEFHRETNMLKKRWRKLYTVSFACLRRTWDRNRRGARGIQATPTRRNMVQRPIQPENIETQSTERDMVGVNQNMETYIDNRNENTTPIDPAMNTAMNTHHNSENYNSNYTDEYQNNNYNSSRDTTIPYGGGVSNETNAKDTSATQINMEVMSEDEERNMDSKTKSGNMNAECDDNNMTSTSSNADKSNQTPAASARFNQNNPIQLVQRDQNTTTTPSRMRNTTSSTHSVGSYNDVDHNEVFSARVPSGGVNKWIYSKMEERGEMDGYHQLLHELGTLMFAGGSQVLGFTSMPQQLDWLDETDTNRVTVPPSQDTFRDGTLYTTCCYAEIKLMKVLQSSLYMMKTVKNRGRELVALVLEQILEANSELFDLKKKLDNGRSALYKKLKLHWAERNSKWGGFPPLKRGYRLLNMLGKGGFAEVWEVFDPITLTVQAAKLHILSHDMDAVERGNVVMRVKNEIDIHKTCRTHPNIVNMKACFEMGDNMLATILELCDDGDLDHYIKLHGPVPEKLAITWTYQILQGLLYMKTLPEGRVHHCDLKPGNILNHRGNIKLADFGLSKMASHDATEVYWGGGGTIWYQPPECLMANTRANAKVPLSDKIDIWAVGCILYEMLFNSRPFGTFCSKSSLSERVYQEAILGVKFPQTYKVSDDCKKLIRAFLAVDPNDRPSIEEALSSQIFYCE